MAEKGQISKDGSDVPYRRRGRPTGKNRIPLSLKERRARNAQYERERRYETSEAMAELIAAAGCNPSLNNSDILATVISQLQKAANSHSSREIEELRHTNKKLIHQIEALEQRLSNWEQNQISPENDNQHPVSGKRKRQNDDPDRVLKRVIKTEEDIQGNIKLESSHSSEKCSSDDEQKVIKGDKKPKIKRL